MRTRTARFDKRITFLKPVKVKDPRFNTSKPQFVPAVRDVAANVQDMLPSRGEQVADGIDVRKRPCRIRIRWRSDVTADMRVQLGTREMEIVSGPAELGRRETMEFMCVESSTQGSSA